MTIEYLKNYFETIERPTFFLKDVYSWRGDYNKVAFTPSLYGTKEKSLELIDRALTEVFQGWKGGYFTYDLNTEIQFETGPSDYNSNILNRLLKQKFNYVVSKSEDIGPFEIISREALS